MRQMSEQLAEDMTRAGIELIVGRLSNITLQSTLLERIRDVQNRDPELVDQREKVLAG